MKEMPLTVKRSLELLGLLLLGALVVVGSNVIMPLLMAFFISIMLLPIHRFLRRKKFPEALAILIPILSLFIFVGLIIWFFSSQVGALIADFPEIRKNVSLHLTAISNWIKEVLHYSTKEQLRILDEQSNKLLNSAGEILTGAAGSVSSAFLFLGILPIYIYLMLFYKNLLVRFIFMWFKPTEHKKVEDVMRETESMTKSYLIGLLIQITYITVLLGSLLMLFGIKHALLIGIIFALLNLIPYLGALIGNILGVLLTLTSSPEIWPIFTVLAVIAFVQFLDNNILMPRIVGSKVKINALSSLVGIFIAGSLAGISGMFLALPIIAVLKIIFDRTENFRHWGVLLGDERPTKSPLSIRRFRRSLKPTDA